MELKLPFGLKNGELIQVSEVESGLKCNCFCPACGHPLVAKKGSKTIHHFAHNKKAECQSALETSLHIASKKVIEDAGYIMLPSVLASIFYMREIELSKPVRVDFDKIYLEKRYNDFIPDIIIEKNGKLLFVEIYVTHKVDEEKLNKIQKSKISIVEIDLSKNEKQIDFKFLNDQVVNSIENKKWLYNKKLENFHSHILNHSIKKKIISRGFAQHVDNCPIPARVWKGKSYANFIDDCLGCKYFVTPDQSNSNIMYCIGHKSEEFINNTISSHKHT